MENPFLSLLINDVTQLFLLRLVNKGSILNLKESVRHKHEDSKVDYSLGECCFERLKETSVERSPTGAYEKVVCYIGFLFILLQDNMNLEF